MPRTPPFQIPPPSHLPPASTPHQAGLRYPSRLLHLASPRRSVAVQESAAIRNELHIATCRRGRCLQSRFNQDLGVNAARSSKQHWRLSCTQTCSATQLQPCVSRSCMWCCFACLNTNAQGRQDKRLGFFPGCRGCRSVCCHQCACRDKQQQAQSLSCTEGPVSSNSISSRSDSGIALS